MVYMYSQSALDVLINSPTTMFAVPLFFQMKIVVMLEKNKPNQQAVIKEICSSIDHYFCTDLYYRHWHTAVIISVQLCFVSITTVWFSFSRTIPLWVMKLLLPSLLASPKHPAPTSFVEKDFLVKILPDGSEPLPKI